MPGLYGQVIWACRAASFVPNAVQKDVSLVQTIVATCTGVAFVSGSLSDLHREGESAGVASTYVDHLVAQGEDKSLQLEHTVET
ncbi:MAG: hypothetical protein ACJ73W_06880 [Rubrobacteraceae bacterium]